MPTVKYGKLYMKDSSGNLVQILPESNINIPSYQGATSSANGVAGLVPAATSANRDNYLKGDGTWGSITLPSTYTGATGSANGTAGLVPAATIAEKDNYLKGDGTWAALTLPSDYVGATAGASGTHGLVPAATSAQRNNYLKGDGTWGTVTTSNYVGATESANGTAGLVPAATSAEKDNYLKGDGTWGTIVQPSIVTSSELTTGTDTTIRTISPKVIHDYITGMDATAVHKTGDEVIAGLKCFTLSSAGGPSGLQMIATDSSVTRYGTPSSDKFLSTCYWSSDALTNQITAANYTSYLLGCIEYASRSDGGRDIKLLCTKPDNSTIAYNSLMLGYDANGVSYAQAPSTSTTRTAGKDIVTRDFIPSDTRIVHTSGNETIAGTKTFSSTISGTADKANKDGSGNVITTTYATKSEIPSSYQGATSSADGVAGLVPAATSANRDKFLKADGTWAEVSTAKEVASMTSEPTAQNTTTLDNGSLIFWNTGSAQNAPQPVYTSGNQTVGGVKTFTAGIFGGTVAMSGNTIDCTAGTSFTKTISANTTFSFINVPSDATCCVTLILRNGGNYTITWPASVKWTEDTIPDLMQNGTDVLTFITCDGGVTWYGTTT